MEMDDLQKKLLEKLGSIDTHIEELLKENSSNNLDVLSIKKEFAGEIAAQSKISNITKQQIFEEIEKTNQKIAELYNISRESVTNIVNIPQLLLEDKKSKNAEIVETTSDIKKELENIKFGSIPLQLMDQQKPIPLEESLSMVPISSSISKPEIGKLTKYVSAEEESKSITPYIHELKPVNPENNTKNLSEVYMDKLNEILEKTNIRTQALENLLNFISNLKKENEELKFLLNSKTIQTTTTSIPISTPITETPKTQMFYEPEKKGFKMTDEQFNKLINSIGGVKSGIKNKMEESIKDNRKNQKELGGFLTGMAEGFIGGSLLTRLGRFIGKIGNLIGLLSGAIVLIGAVSKPLSQAIDYFFGTKTELIFDRLREQNGLNNTFALRMAEMVSLGYIGLKNILKTKKLQTLGKATTPMNLGVFGKTLDKVFPKLPEFREMTSSAIYRGLGKVPLVGSLLTKGLGKFVSSGFLRRIPILGGLIDLGYSYLAFTQGDTAGGIINLLSAATNLLYLLGPEMAAVAIPIQLGLTALDWFLTKEADGNIEKKQGIIPSLFGFGSAKKPPVSLSPKTTPATPPTTAPEEPIKEINESSITKTENKEFAKDIIPTKTRVYPDGSISEVPDSSYPKIRQIEQEKTYILKPISGEIPNSTPSIEDIAMKQKYSETPPVVHLSDSSIEKLKNIMPESNPVSPINIMNNSMGAGNAGSLGLSSERDEIYSFRKRVLPPH